MQTPEGVFVHALASCESTEVGTGTRIWPFAQVLDGAKVGRDCNLCGHVFIEGGARVGDRVVVKNGVQIWDLVTLEDDVFVGHATFTNDPRPRAGLPIDPSRFRPTLVRRGATIGANATIVCGVTIGERAFIGAGALVTKDIPAHALVLGHPADLVGWACDCGLRLDGDLRCECGKRYRPLEGSPGLTLDG